MCAEYPYRQPLPSTPTTNPYHQLLHPTNLTTWPTLSQPSTTQRALKASLQRLELDYVDSYLIHSPLPGHERRLASWAAMLELRDEGLCRSVGVANFGRRHLDELAAEFGDAGLPQTISLELSPFNQHREIVGWCSERQIAVECAAWSKLSGDFNWGGDDNKAALEAFAKVSGWGVPILLRLPTTSHTPYCS